MDFRHLFLVSSREPVNHGRHFVSRVVMTHPTEYKKDLGIVFILLASA